MTLRNEPEQSPYRVWVAAIARWRRWILVGSALLCVVAALSLTRLHLDIDVLNMLPEGTPAFDDFRTFVAQFGQLDELVVLLEAERPQTLERFADEFAARLQKLPTVKEVHSRIDDAALLDGILGRYLFNYLSAADYAELAERLTPEGIERQVTALREALNAPFDLAAARAMADDPLGLRRLAAAPMVSSYAQIGSGVRRGYFESADGRALLLFVRPKASAFDIAFSEKLMNEVRSAEAATRHETTVGDVQVFYTGSYAFALEDAATMRWDIGRYTVLALIGVLIVFYIGYRNLRILPFVTYPLAVTTLVTFALSLLLFSELNAVSISFAAILYGLSIDSGICFYTRLLQEKQRPGRDGAPGMQEAVRATLAGLGRANLAASSTTAAAFLVIGFSCLSAVRQLGVLTAVGMMITSLEFFTLYPALAFSLSERGVTPLEDLQTPRLGRLAELSVRHARIVALSAAGVGVLLLAAAPYVGLDVALNHLRPRNSEAARVQDEIEARFGSRNDTAAVLVRRADLEKALEDSELVAARLRVYRAEGLVSSLQSVSTVLPSARTQRARLKLFDQLPRTAAAADLRQALQRHGFVAERFAGFLQALTQPKHDLVRFGDPALAPLSVLIEHHIRRRSGEFLVATYFAPASVAALRTVAARLRRELAPGSVAVASRALLESELAVVLHRELAYFLVFSLLGNAVLLLIGFGSLRIALGILAPVVFAVVALFAAMALGGIPLDPVNLVVTPMIFGLAVDYGVYIAARSREQGSAAAAVRWEGRAVVVAGATTIVGYGFLGLSRYPPLASMGRLAGAGLFLCLVLSFILLPALLFFAMGDGAERRDG
jgi:uncharacterized protein